MKQKTGDREKVGSACFSMAIMSEMNSNYSLACNEGRKISPECDDYYHSYSYE